METGGPARQRIHRIWPFALALVALIVSRLWFALTFPVAQISDYEAYYNEARGFAGLAPLTVTWLNSIGPKLFFSVWFRLFGDGLRGIGVANTLFYAAAVGLVAAAASRAFDRATALVFLGVSFLSLSEMYFINLASSETLGGLFIAAVYFLIAPGALSWRRTVILGIVGGLSVYNRSNMLPLGALVFAHEMLATRRIRPALSRAIVAQTVALAVTLPLCAFNLSHFGRFTPLIANAANLWYGNNPRLSGDAHSYPKVPEEYPPGSPGRAELRREYSVFYESPDANLDLSQMNPYEVDDLKVRYAAGWIAKNPGRYIHLIGARFQFLFFSCTYGEVPFRYYDDKNPAQPRWTFDQRRRLEQARLPIRRLYQWLIGGAFLGLAISFLSSPPSRFLTSAKASALLILAFYSTPFLLSLAANRYHVPVLSLAWVYLAHGLVVATRWVRRVIS